MSSTNLSSHTGRHNKQFFHSAAGNAKIYLKNYNIIPPPHTPNGNIHPHNIIIHSLFFPISPFTLFHFLGNFLTSWTLPFLGHFLFLRDLIFLLFLWGPFLISISPSSVRGSPTHRYNSVDLRTRLPGCVDHQVCSTYVSTPQGHLLVPVPAATYNTCSAHN